jgi:hypothetical protein
MPPPISKSRAARASSSPLRTRVLRLAIFIFAFRVAVFFFAFPDFLFIARSCCVVRAHYLARSCDVVRAGHSGSLTTNGADVRHGSLALIGTPEKHGLPLLRRRR